MIILKQLMVVVIGGLLITSTAQADLCTKVRDLSTTQETKDQIDFYENKIMKETEYYGNRTWNEIILECNRKRDTKGKEITNALSNPGNKQLKNQLLKITLEPKIIRGKYNFFGNIASQLKYTYILSKEKGLWTMIIPYNPIMNEVVKDRVDFYMGYRFVSTPTSIESSKEIGGVNDSYAAWTLYEKDQVDLATNTLKTTAKPIAETLCTTSTYFSGKKEKYKGKTDENSNKRDKENKHISLGKIQYRYNVTTLKLSDNWDEGCRVKKSVDLYWLKTPGTTKVEKVKPQEWVLDNFVRVAEKYWSTPNNFTLKLLLKGVNEKTFTAKIRNMLDDSDYLTIRFANKFMPYKSNQMYKSNIIQFNNFSTMTTNGTYFHEVGHAFGLDDEYSNDNKVKACEHTQYNNNSTDTYQMCTTGAGETRTIYHFIALSRYITNQNACNKDSECKTGEWCDAGIDFTKNKCRALLNDGASCPLVGGGHACKSGHCKFAKCYTPASINMGDACFVNDQCKQGKCNNAVDGTNGICVCDQDNQCGTGQYCNKGLDFTKNTCKSLKSDNESCALVDGGRTCQSGHCKAGRCYTPNSVSMGDYCYVNEACSKGKCSSIDGTKGTCVCDSDNNCGSGFWCDKGLDLKKNSCKQKLDKGEVCGTVGELGVGHRCKSNKCKISGVSTKLKCK